MASVQLSAVNKAFGAVHVLSDIDLDIADGEFTVFVGPSGCGKSTLLRLIAGLDEPTSGEIRIGERPVNGLEPARRGIAMVFQSYALYPHMSLYENLAFGLKLAKMPRADIDAAVTGAAQTLGIDHLLDRKPRALSGGQRQRVAIGRAIVRKPQVFLFDEPLSNLDAALRVRMRYEFASLHKQLATTMIYVTHDQIEAMTLADRIVVLSEGRIEQVGAPMTLYDHPDNLFVAGFIGSPRMNFLPGEVVEAGSTGAKVLIGPNAVIRADVDAGSAKPGDRVTIGIRPEHIRRRDGLNRINAEVRFVEALGSLTFAYLDFEGLDEPITWQVDGGEALHEGPVTVGLPAEHLHQFDADGRAFKRLRRPKGRQSE
jgi:multiple sugar transport system ATP-binding protein